MPETHTPATERLCTPEPYFFRPPFCDPGAPMETGFDIVSNYDPIAFAHDAVRLGDAMQAAYDYTKVPRPAPEGANGIDLTTPHSVNGMVSHVIAHAVTGDVRHGVSTTRVIPYWDREAFVVGLGQLIEDPAERQLQLEVIDGLCINVLRTLSHYYVGRVEEHGQNVKRLREAIAKGQRSKESPIEEQEAAMGLDRVTLAIEREHAIAKIKQLLWLVDQQPSEKTRVRLLGELADLTGRATNAGIAPEELGIDMGVDTGISSATHRPPYDITMFVQLRHLGADIYELPQDQCHVLTLGQVLESICRRGDGLPAYEQDGRYRLPLDMRSTTVEVPQQRQRRSAGHVTGLFVESP